jgi:hypothetical protein
VNLASKFVAAPPWREPRARHHPRAIAALWAWQTTLALAASLPAAAFVGAAYGAGARGDAVLWDPGGHALVELVRRGSLGLTPTAVGVASMLTIGAVAGLLPNAAVLLAMSRRAQAPAVPRGEDAARDPASPALRESAASAVFAAFPALVKLLAVVTVAQGVIVGLGGAAAAFTSDLLEGRIGEARSDPIAFAVGAMFAVAAVALGIAHDLGRGAVVRSGAGALRALVAGVGVLRRAPLSVGWGWSWRASMSLALVVGVAAFAQPLGGRGGAALVLLAFLHQAVIAARVSLRVSWLARALRALGDDGYRAESDR